jgi:hypothetical protein
MRVLALHMVTVGVASSYLTLGVLASDTAAAWWWVYALVMFVLAIVSLGVEWRR